MRREAILSLSLLLLAAAGAAAQEWAEKMFVTTAHDFGSVARGSKAEFLFNFRNVYVEDVHVASVRSSCGCTIPRVDVADVKTYGESAVIATFNTQAFRGQRGATVTVTFDKPFYAQVQLHVKGYIRTDVVFNPASVQFGEITQGEAADRTVDIHYAGRGDWEVLDVTSANPNLSAKVSQTRREGGTVVYSMSVALDKDAPAGYLRDQIVLVTNDRNKPQVPIAVEGVVQPSIVVSPEALFMGVVHPGQSVTKQLVVRGRQPFRITSIDCDGDEFQIEAAEKEAAKPLHLIPVTFAAGSAPGKVHGKIRIQTDLGNGSSELPTYAVVSPE